MTTAKGKTHRNQNRMYKIDKRPYGYRLTMSGHVNEQQIQEYITELKELLPNLPQKFGIMVDMREMIPLTPDNQASLVASQKLVADRLTRSATIVNDNAIVKMQFRRLSKAGGVVESKRFIDASADPNWNKTAEDWIVMEKDPYLSISL